jgi:glyoxylase-like metal-dependent hydrolase (beta-lactamase superfamily II)
LTNCQAKITKIRPRVWFISEAFVDEFPYATGNITVVATKGGGYALIDCGFTEPFTESVWKALESEGFDPAKLELVALTHSHLDHFEAIDLLRRKAPRAKLAAHRLARNDLANQVGWARQFPCVLPGDRERLDTVISRCAKAPPATLDVLLEEGDLLELGDYRLRVLHTLGHEVDNVCYYDPDKKFLVSGSFLRAPGAAWTYFPHSGGVAAERASLKRLSGIDFDLAVPNHGEPVVGRDAIGAAFTDAFATLGRREAAIVKGLADGRRTIEEIEPIYPGFPGIFPWYDHLMLYAHLTDLVARGLVERSGPVYKPTGRESGGEPS